MRPEARRAVSAVVRRAGGLVLAVRRPDEPREELPGLRGLPAVTLRDGESPEDGVRRIGWEKLGVELTPLRALAEGEQQRPDYTLRMIVYEATLAGEPKLPGRRVEAPGTRYEAFDWLPPASFREAADRGSLCCRLFLGLTPNPSPTRGEGNPPVSDQERLRLHISPRMQGDMVEVARQLRRESTPSEETLWHALRKRQLYGRKFRRQQPIGPFVVDFFCAEERLVVEVDGPIHQTQGDAGNARQRLLEATGLHILRVTASEVEGDLDQVLRAISASFSAPT